jgi:hypothetical protein
VRLPNPANATIGISVFVVLAVTVILILAFAHAWAPEAAPDLSKRCFETFGTAQWPKWIGCAMAVHETLAAGLVGAGGALFAAWLAYSAVQQQFAQQKEERERLQAEAKEAAVTSLKQVVDAAASTLSVIRVALRQDKDLEQKGWLKKDRLSAMAAFTDPLGAMMGQLRAALDHWSLTKRSRQRPVH